MPRKGYLDAFFVVIIWTGFLLVSRLGGKTPLLPYDVVALRFSVASLVLLPVWWHRGLNLLQPRLLALALVGGLGYCLFVYYAFHHAPVAHAGILLPGLLPFEAAIFGILMLGERPSRRRVAGLLTIGLGVVSLAAGNMGSGGDTWLGDICFVIAGTCWAFYATLVRKWGIEPWDATIAGALISAALYLPVYALFLPKAMAQSPWDAIMIQGFYQGVMAMVVAMMFYMRAMKALGPTRIGLCMALIPAIASLAAVPLLGEPLTPPIVAGLLLTVLGAWVGSKG